MVMSGPTAMRRFLSRSIASALVLGFPGPRSWDLVASLSLAHICEADIRVSAWSEVSKENEMHCLRKRRMISPSSRSGALIMSASFCMAW